MRRLPAAVMWLFVVVFPICALGASSHGGFGGHAGSSHAASGFRGSGFSGQTFHGPAFQGRSQGGPRYASPSGPYRFTNGSRFTGNRQGVYPTSRFGTRLGMNGRSTYSPSGSYRRSRFREPYRSAFAFGGLPWYGPWLDPWGPDFLDYPDDSAYDNGSITPFAPDYSGQGYDYPLADQADQDQMAPPANYQPFYGTPPVPWSNTPVTPINEEAVTLIFKDHRPNQVIHNYLLTGTTLTVWDRNPRNIPVNEIDIAATEKTNRDAGVDFYLPGDVKP